MIWINWIKIFIIFSVFVSGKLCACIHTHTYILEKEMANHSSVLAWRIPGMGEPVGLPSRVAQSRNQLKWLSSSKMLWKESKLHIWNIKGAKSRGFSTWTFPNLTIFEVILIWNGLLLVWEFRTFKRVFWFYTLNCKCIFLWE